MSDWNFQIKRGHGQTIEDLENKTFEDKANSNTTYGELTFEDVEATQWNNQTKN